MTPRPDRLVRFPLRPLLAAALLSTFVFGVGPAHAAKDKKPRKAAWVALVHTEGDVPAAWATKLRIAAEKAPGGRVWIEPPAVTLEELQLALSCDGWNARCAGTIADTAGGSNALVIDLQRSETGVLLRVEGVDANGALVGTAERLELPGVDDDSLRLAEAWVQGAVKGARPTVLVVTSDLPGDEVLLDNAMAGKTPLTLLDVVPGEHALLLRREGRAPLSRTITVTAGAVNREHGVLSAAGPAMASTPTVGTTVPAPTPKAPPTPAGPPTMAIVGWGLGGVGGAAAIAGGVMATLFGLPILEYSNNVEGGALRPDYKKLGSSEPITGAERVQHLADTFGIPASDVGDPEKFGAALERTQNLAVTGIVLASAGVLIAGTGVALALTAGGEAADEAAAPASPAAGP